MAKKMPAFLKKGDDKKDAAPRDKKPSGLGPGAAKGAKSDATQNFKKGAKK